MKSKKKISKKFMNKKTIIGIILMFVGFLLIFTKFFGFGNFEIDKTLSLIISRTEFWILTLLMFLFAKYYEKKDFLLITEEKKKWWFYPLATFSVIALVTIVMNIIVLIENNLGFHTNNKIETELAKIFCSNKILLVFTCITAGVTEELLFRGFLLSRIKMLTKSNWIAVFLSALMFGLAHFGYDNFNRMFFPFIIGLIFGSFYVKYRSISVLIACHIIMDLYSLMSQC